MIHAKRHAFPLTLPSIMSARPKVLLRSTFTMEILMGFLITTGLSIVCGLRRKRTPPGSVFLWVRKAHTLSLCIMIVTPILRSIRIGSVYRANLMGFPMTRRFVSVRRPTVQRLSLLSDHPRRSKSHCAVSESRNGFSQPKQLSETRSNRQCNVGHLRENLRCVRHEVRETTWAHGPS